MPAIRITRGSTWADKIRKYKIFIDDVYQGDIERDQTKDYEVPHGIHTVVAKIDWCTSNTVVLDVRDEGAHLDVESSMSLSKSWIPFIEIIYITILRKRYLRLKEREAV
ncbi:MAG: hypothetical protein FWC71_07560 [Defluviitaleaceae bacterium]|nr:hypothetical protein [Defluviitaleaceae bacterium]